MSAMRVGLLTRFLGYLGIIAGILTIIPVVPIPIIEAYWLLALAYLISGRWPSGVPPAWSTGQIERWPGRPRRAPAAGTAPRPRTGQAGDGARGPADPRAGAQQHAVDDPQAQAQAA